VPIHAWSKTDAGLFHHFHQSWIVRLCDALNGMLGPGHFALIEQSSPWPPPERAGLTAMDLYALKADRIAIHRRLSDLVAVIEVVSPGNRSSRGSIRSLVDKAVALLRQDVHLLIIDLFPPTAHDPRGIHGLIWGELAEEPFEVPAGKPLTLAAYSAGAVKVGFIEPVAVNDVLPEMPLFLEPDRYVLAPLEPTYQTTWDVCPVEFREAVIEDSAR
jgi:hypothetical protein